MNVNAGSSRTVGFVHIKQHYASFEYIFRSVRHFPGIVVPRSPDLSPSDFFLWGYLKNMVYVNSPHTTAELQTIITTAISNINTATLRRVSRNLVKRIRFCICERGRNFQHLL